ncbi:MAG: SH3 domain-containing protein, partial [Gemmatimonadota bacterium]
LLARTELRAPVAVTLDADVALRTAPALQSETILQLPAGTALRVKEVRDRWLLTERPGVGQGWVARSEAGVL